jgi:bifunctional non-homologous end joining protein LigD
MLAALSEPPIAQVGLVYEPKYDGIRAIVTVAEFDTGYRFSGAAKRRKTIPGVEFRVAIRSRNGVDKTRQFPEIGRALDSLAARLDGPVVLDGEIVAVDRSGRPLGFQHIQGRIHLTSDADIARAAREQPAALILFDLLKDGDEDLRNQPLAARRLRLQERIRPRATERASVRLSDIALDDGRAMLQRARAEGWEGLIVKDAGSRYASGKRSPAWRKLKLLKQQEFVVGGWTEPRQSRQHFGALLLGYYDATGAFRWAGSVGTGFDQKELDRVAALLAPLAAGRSPFDDEVSTAEAAHWVKPVLVVEVRFTEWTGEGRLRQPAYLGTREDKRAAQVTREDQGTGQRAEGTGEVKGQRVKVKGTTALGGNADRGLHDVVQRLRELEDARKDGEVVLPNGNTVRVTNLAKVFWPDLKITKGDLLRYYVDVSPLILPVLSDRPLVMKRFPNGIGKPSFYQQRHPEPAPAGVRREALPADIDPPDDEGPRDRLIGGSLTTLLYMTQLASISQDPWFSRTADPLHPDAAAIDLDPGEGAGFDRVLDVARWVKDEMDRLGVPGMPKTSGSRGLHIYIPLPPGTTYESGQLLCQLIATLVASKHPAVSTVERMVRRRPRATVYIDFLQNILGKTLAAAYSVRATDWAGVSTPLTWKEVARGLDPRDYTIRTALARLRKTGDLWANLSKGRPVDLAAVLRRAR